MSEPVFLFAAPASAEAVSEYSLSPVAPNGSSYPSPPDSRTDVIFLPDTL